MALPALVVWRKQNGITIASGIPMDKGGESADHRLPGRWIHPLALKMHLLEMRFGTIQSLPIWARREPGSNGLDPGWRFRLPTKRACSLIC